MSTFANNPQGIEFNFDNPIEINEGFDEFGDPISEPKEETEGGLSFDGVEIPEEEVPENENPFVEKKPEEEDNAGNADNAEKKETEKEIPEDLAALSEVAPALANLLYEKGHITEIPEGIDPDAFDIDAFWKTVDYNIQKKEAEKFNEGAKYYEQELVRKLPPVAKQILGYSLGDNLEDSDILGYVEALVHSKGITDLNPENVSDAEKIVAEYYKAAGWKPNEVEDKVNNLIATDGLLSEASLLKPKLDEQANKIAQEKVEEQRQLKEQDLALQSALEQRVRSILDKGKINDIPLTREQLVFLYNATVNNEVPVEVKGGKIVEMGLAEALVRKHKYSQDGNLENLFLALLIMEEGPTAIEKFIARKAKTNETKEFVREVRFSNSKKSGYSNSQKPAKDSGFILRVK